MSAIRAAIRALTLALGLCGAAPAVLAQTAAPASTEEEPGPPDYVAWERTATKAENQTQDRNTSDDALTTMRGYLVEWRATFQAAQGVNATRIATLRGQIDALGPPPADGKVEAEEIAVRRTELNDQLARLQAPVIAADEAYRRADGLIKEIDRQLRERQADELLQVWPMPINPANWGAGAVTLRDTSQRIWGEVEAQWMRASAREELKNNLPLILLYSVIGAFHYLFRRNFLLISIDPAAAEARGLSIRLWDFLFYVSFGFVVTSSVAIAGVLLVFCYLIVPSVGAMLFADRIGPRLAIGWTMGTLVSALGVYLSVVLDFPTGATIVCTFGAVLAVMFLVHYLLYHGRDARELRGARSGTVVAAGTHNPDSHTRGKRSR